MTGGFTLSADYFVRFMLVFFRLGGIVIFAPFFSHRSFPILVRISLTFFLSLIVFPIVTDQTFVSPTSIYSFFLAIFHELMIGLVIGFCAQLFFTGIQFGGELISVQIGLSTATLLDPGQSEQITVIAQLYTFFAMVIFIGIGGHHLLVRSMVETFDIVPLGGFRMTDNIMSEVRILFGQIFTIGFQISAPVFVASFLTTVAMALITRAIPQINVFMIAPPFQIIIGFTMIALSLNASIFMFQHLFEKMADNLHTIILEMGEASKINS